jgi:hypothetical protein
MFFGIKILPYIYHKIEKIYEKIDFDNRCKPDFDERKSFRAAG